MDNQQQALRELALFSGAGGGILGGKLLGWRTVCAVEWEPYPAAVLCARQNDGFLEDFPIWDDVQTFDGRPWRGLIDVVSGGFPCQDISVAGKRAGIDGERSSMWNHMARIIGEVRPRYAFVENSPNLVNLGLDRVLGDLTEMGYDCKWGIVSAADTVAPHLRERCWIRAEMANTSMYGDRRNTREIQAKDEFKKTKRQKERVFVTYDASKMAYSNGTQCKGNKRTKRSKQERTDTGISCEWWSKDPGDEIESGVGRMAYGLAFGVDRLKAIGNGQVPMAAALAWELLT